MPRRSADTGTRIREILDSTVANFEELRKEIDAEFPPVPEPPPNGGTTVKVKTGEDLNAAFRTLLTSGGTILMAPGLHQSLDIPERAINAPLITLTTDTTNLPAPGKRIDPLFLPGLARIGIVPRNHNVRINNKAHNIAFVGVAVDPPFHYSASQVEIGGDDSTMKTAADCPTDLLFDRLYCYGDPKTGSHRGISLNGRNIKIAGSYFKDIFEFSRDSQAVGGWHGTKNISIDNSFLEGGAENIMFGGGGTGAIDMAPEDVVIRNCTLSKNFEWMKIIGPQGQTGPTVKCLFEIKDLKRLRIVGCLFENNWARDWGTGVAIMLKACNQWNTPWSTCEDVEISNCIVRNMGSFVGLVASKDGGRPSGHMSNVKFSNILAYNIKQGPWTGTARMIAYSNPPHGIVFDHITCLNDYSIMTGERVSDPANAFYSDKGSKFTMTNSIAFEGAYGFFIAGAGIGPGFIDHSTLGHWLEKDVRGNVFGKGERPQMGIPATNGRIEPADIMASFDQQYRIKAGSAAAAAAQTTDGKMVGADVDAILEATGATI
jgi:hypothetical protein